MNIILSHRQQDFDSLASMVAAQKLYPGSIIVMDGKANPYVQEFLALSKDQLPIKNAKEISLDEVNRVVLVDTQDLLRTGEIGVNLDRKKGIAIDIYDHHPFSGQSGLHKPNILIEPVGACATLLVEKIIEQRIPITSFEATIIALGIYEDTGSLLFENTTVRDVKAVAHLLEQGANLGVINQYLRKPLTKEQKNIFNQLLDNGKQKVMGMPLFLSWAECDDYVGGLALIAHRICELEGEETSFFVVKMENRVYIIGRSTGKGLPVNKILACFGGSGHERAASATVKGGDVQGLIAELINVIRKFINIPVLVKDMMSTPVKTVKPDTEIKDVEQILLRYGHTGVPVVDGSKLVGIISRRDVEKAMKHGLGHAPVKGFMATNVVTIDASAPWEEVQSLMVQYDVGRIPVLENGRLVGIVSRSDVLRSIHGQAVPKETVLVKERSYAIRHDILNLLDRLKPEIVKILKLARETAEESDYSVYIVGGFVRDLLLLLPTQDLDLVVEGNGTKFALELAKKLPEGELTIHSQFGTATIRFPDGTHLDIASSRWEYYKYPGALPEVEEARLKQDLFRRDFTINALAICLSKNRYGELVDYYGGYADLQKGLIRILHNLSFVDDPTRMLRAIRFARRYQFSLEKETSMALETALHNGVLKKISAERFTEEFLHIFREVNYLEMGQDLIKYGILEEWFDRLLPWNFTSAPEQKRSDSIRVRFLRAIALFNDEEIEILINRLKLPKSLREGCETYCRAKAQLKTAPTDLCRIDMILSKVDNEVFQVLAEQDEFKKIINSYGQALSRYKPSINGKILVERGIREGRKIGELLNELRRGWLTGSIQSPEEEEEYLQKLLNRS